MIFMLLSSHVKIAYQVCIEIGWKEKHQNVNLGGRNGSDFIFISSFYVLKSLFYSDKKLIHTY